eukprot:Seg15632.1 transcript_id=Seg15632.1/GoldUCD/mRNA.D3Y31 product="hypothetical protein" protein_id=Seg15632.1/GoldUCD/D3Y31
MPAHMVRSESSQPASMAPQRCVGPYGTMPAHMVRPESFQPASMAPQRCVGPHETMPAHMVRSESFQSPPMAPQRCEGPPSSRISHMVYTQTAQPRMVPPRYHEDPIIGMSSQQQSWQAPSPQQSWQAPSPQQSWQFQSRAPEQLPGYLSMEPITLDSPQPRSHAHGNWRENIQHATPLRAGEEAHRAGEVSLNEAEEDRKIAKKLLENVLDGIDWENGSRDYWQDKKHAAIRAHKRLELKNEELEGEMKRAGVTMRNKLRRLEMFEEEALTFQSIIRRLTENCNRGETVYSRRQPQDMASAVKLPKMELKTFDGNVLKWHEFWEGFHHGVHNHPTLPDHQTR